MRKGSATVSEDREDGLTQAKKHVEKFLCPEALTGGDKTVIPGKEYDADNQKNSGK